MYDYIFDNAEAPEKHIKYLNKLICFVENEFGDPDHDLKGRIWESYCNEFLSFDIALDAEQFAPIC